MRLCARLVLFFKLVSPRSLSGITSSEAFALFASLKCAGVEGKDAEGKIREEDPAPGGEKREDNVKVHSIPNSAPGNESDASLALPASEVVHNDPLYRRRSLHSSGLHRCIGAKFAVQGEA